MGLTPIKIYKTLLQHFGKQDWWPIDENYHREKGSDPRFEIMIGAILTQNTAWANVEKALQNLKNKDILIIEKIKLLDVKKLKDMIQPSGFFNQKAKRLKALTSYLYKNYNGNLDEFFYNELKQIREELLSINGIGPETADSILLYAGDKSVFAVDAYTKRICERLPVETDGKTYDEIQKYFEKEIRSIFSEEEIVPVFKEFHALIVVLAKNYCKKRPDCPTCPLGEFCEFKKYLHFQ